MSNIGNRVYAKGTDTKLWKSKNGPQVSNKIKNIFKKGVELGVITWEGANLYKIAVTPVIYPNGTYSGYIKIAQLTHAYVFKDQVDVKINTKIIGNGKEIWAIKNVNVRNSASTNSEIKTTAQPNQFLGTLTGDKKNNFSQIAYVGGGLAWVANGYFTTQDPNLSPKTENPDTTVPPNTDPNEKEDNNPITQNDKIRIGIVAIIIGAVIFYFSQKKK